MSDASNPYLFETALSKIAAMPRGERLGVSVLVGGPLLVGWILSCFASLIFVFPIWIIILVKSPYWLTPLFLIGPVLTVLFIFFHARFVFWRRGETRPWSRLRLMLFVLRHFGKTALFGHTAGLVAALASIVLRDNAFGLAGEFAFWFGPAFYNGPVERAVFGKAEGITI